jgi:hypothetical protein
VCRNQIWASKHTCVYGSCTYQHVFLHEINIPQANYSYSDGQKALHLWKEIVTPCPQYMAIHEPIRFGCTSQSNYQTIILVFAPYFHIKFPYRIFLLISGKMICTNLFSASCIPLDLSTLIISIKTYRHISIFNQMFQDSNGSSRRLSQNIVPEYMLR